ncbi:MAG TPA: hypothetical protein VFB60_16750 [Ktedonobacteraceae bacterium]|nr:hypothetical protein [Ktedonobacteraceae bacterium]
MEDYHAAFSQRIADVNVLNTSERRTAAMHLGGVAIECLLKHIIFTSLPRGASKEWKTDGNDPGHTITNPGHSYQEALNRHNRLRSRIQQFPFVLNWLHDVEQPEGHFIDMRYSGKEPGDDKYKRWITSYQCLIAWLQKQATSL